MATVRSPDEGLRLRQQQAWWKRKTKRTKLWWALVGLVACIVVISTAACAGDNPSSSTTTNNPASSTGSTRTESTGAGEAPSTVPSSSTTAAAGVSGQLQVHYIDVGQGDSILILSPEGKVMLIDGGERDSGAVAYLQAKGITHIDLMVATHPHSDHIGGLVDALEVLPVSQVVTNGVPTTTHTYERFLEGIANSSATYTEAKRGDKLTLGSLTFDVLSPENAAADDLNNGSLVLRLVFGKVTFLFTGDADDMAEAAMLARNEDVSAQILKVGQHGGDAASSPEFLAAVKPEVAIYSCALGDSDQHPAAVTLADLADVGAKVYGTDVNGTVVVTSDGSTYQVQAEKGEAREPPSVTTTEG